MKRVACLELTLARGLVENARRIASLLAIVQRWKTSEVALDGADACWAIDANAKRRLGEALTFAVGSAEGQ